MYRIPECDHDEEQQRINQRNPIRCHSKVVVDHEGDLSPSQKTGPLVGLSVPRD